MLNLIIRFAQGAPTALSVPDMGLTPREWAVAVFTATHVPATNRYGVPGAEEVAAALADHPDGRRPLDEGDKVEVAGRVVTCLAVPECGHVWPAGGPTFSEAVPVPVPAGPVLHVDKNTPPPEALAYVEDRSDRLWTGRGHGVWRCLTDPAGRTVPSVWSTLWVEHGPVVPLVPVQLADLAGHAQAAAGGRF